jgi:hypothetical protein
MKSNKVQQAQMGQSNTNSRPHWYGGVKELLPGWVILTKFGLCMQVTEGTGQWAHIRTIMLNDIESSAYAGKHSDTVSRASHCCCKTRGFESRWPKKCRASVNTDNCIVGTVWWGSISWLTLEINGIQLQRSILQKKLFYKSMLLHLQKCFWSFRIGPEWQDFFPLKFAIFLKIFH